MSETLTPSLQVRKTENPLLNLAFNLIIPILILEKGAHHLGENGPLKALLIALAFPVVYGFYDWIRRKKFNWLSLFGLMSILITGGLAVIQADGIWFAISEASLPLMLGVGVFASAFSSKPFVSTFILNESVMDLEKIRARIREVDRESDFKNLLKTSTLFFSLSFFISATLNFFLAQHIFTPIDPALAEDLRAQMINDQLADLRYWSLFVIMIPMFLFSALVLWHLLRGLRLTTGLKLDEIMRNQ